MTKKDYELIASVFSKAISGAWRDSQSIEYIRGIEWTAVDMAKALGATNPRFETHRFLNAARAQ
jgi:hypothetical protein